MDLRGAWARLGLIGAGRMGRTHLRALAGSERVAVTAIAEMSAAARSAVAAPGVTLLASPAEMLAAAALDGVLIAAPTDQHGAIIAEVAARGLPILCEKPCGLTAAVAHASAQTAAAAGVPLQVAYWRRFVPGLRRLHDRIAAGEFGVIHLVTCYQWDEQPPTTTFRAHSGGIAIDMGVHEFDQLRWLTSQDISSLAAVASGQAPDEIPDVDGSAVAMAAASYGVPATVSDWRELIARDDVDMVDICTPPGTHAQMAQQAATAGKAVLCEKPLALNYPEAAAALVAVIEAGVHHAVGFNYRRLPAVALMQRMIAEGAIGELRLWRATWLSDEFADPATPYDWRFDRAMGGTTIADLGCHLIDMALTMAGPVESTAVCDAMEISAEGGRWVAIDEVTSDVRKL